MYFPYFFLSLHSDGFILLLYDTEPNYHLGKEEMIIEQ